MADVNIDIELVTKAFNQALKESSDKVKGFQIQVEKGQKGVTTSFKKIDDQADKTNKGFTVLSGTIASFVGNLAANAFNNFVGGLKSLSSGVIDGALRFEQLSVQFEVLTGSAQNAQAVLKDLTEFAASTPFQLEDIASAGAQLLGFQIPAEQVKDRLREIGDVAAAANKPIGDIAQIFGQVQAAGKLTGERLLQFQERAIPIGPAIAKTLGIANEAVKQAVSDGKVSAEIFNKAFASLSEAGGPAFEGLIKQSKTLGGLISTVKDNFTLLSVEIGNALLPFLKELATTTLGLIQNNKDLLIGLGIEAFKALAVAVSLVINAFNIFRAAITSVDVVIKSLFVAFEEVKAVVYAVGEGVINTAIALRELAGADPSPSLQNAAKSLSTLRQESNITSEAIQQDISGTIEAREKEGQALQDFAEKLRNSITTEKEIESERLTARKEATDAAIAQATQAEQARQDAIKQIQAQFKEEENVVRAEIEIAETENEIEKIEKIRLNELAKVEIIRQAELEKAALVQDSLQKQKDVETANQKARLGNLKANLKAESDERKFNAKQEEQILNTRLAATQGYIGAALTLSKQGSAQQKALQSANALISTYTAANQALSSPPGPPFTLPLVGAVIAQGLANVVKINSAGNFAQGGIVPGNSFTGDQLTANVNSGEAILNRSQQQRFLNIANGKEQAVSAGLSSEDIINIVSATVANLKVTLEANDVELARSVSRGVEQGIVIGSN